MEPTKIAFLIGSGFSHAAEMPSTAYITDNILSQNECFSSFAKYLKCFIEAYYSKKIVNRPVNYEDIYYLASQICDSEKLNMHQVIEPLDQWY